MRNFKRYGLLLMPFLMFGCAQTEQTDVQDLAKVETFLASNYQQAQWW